MDGRSGTESIVRNAYAARTRNDLEACLQAFTPDARFRLAGSAETSPAAMSCCGTEGLRTALAGLIETFPWLDHQILSLLVDGDRAAVHGRARMRTPNGQEVETELADFIEVRDGRIASFTQFCDTALAARLMAG